MDLLEYQGKQLFARHGLDVSDGHAVTTVEDAVAAANEIGYPVVVKAQVLIGGRGKAGGVKLASDEDEAREHATNILGLDIKRPHRRTAVDRDTPRTSRTSTTPRCCSTARRRSRCVMFSKEGGIDIEEVAEKTPEKLDQAPRRPARRPDARTTRSRSPTRGGVDDDVVDGVADALVALYEVWIEEDATLAEINPLIVTPDRKVKALDAKVTLDGNALSATRRTPSSGPRRRRPAGGQGGRAGRQYVKLDGNIGILGNGAGLVMSTLDVVAQHGGEPANFLDAGGGSDAEKVKQASS